MAGATPQGQAKEPGLLGEMGSQGRVQRQDVLDEGRISLGLCGHWPESGTGLGRGVRDARRGGI